MAETRPLSQVRNIFAFVLLLFGEFKCCLLPYGRHYTSPLSSTAKKNDKTEYRKKSPPPKSQLGSQHVFLFYIGRAEIKHVLVGVLAFKL